MLGLCAQAGLVEVDVLAIVGTKLHANASEDANCDYQQLARQILAEADAVDREEDEHFGERRGDGCPRTWRPVTAARSSSLTPSATLSDSAQKRPGRSRRRARNGCETPSVVCRPSSATSGSPVSRWNRTVAALRTGALGLDADRFKRGVAVGDGRQAIATRVVSKRRWPAISATSTTSVPERIRFVTAA